MTTPDTLSAPALATGRALNTVGSIKRAEPAHPCPRHLADLPGTRLRWPGSWRPVVTPNRRPP